MDKDIIHELEKRGVSRLSPIFERDAFARLDPSEDESFYKKDRFVNHLDEIALDTVKRIIGRLVIEENPTILDLMAGWDSHIPCELDTSRVIGLGLNENELKANGSLSDYVLHDLNTDPKLPFPDNHFDAVINTVSVDYLIDPIRVFQDVGRILKPGGLFLVIFSNRMFPQKAVKIWRESSEDERIILIEEFFKGAGAFESPLLFVSKAKTRPKDDKYSDYSETSDPVYALYADKKEGTPSRKKRPSLNLESVELINGEELEKRKRSIRDSRQCPYCGERMLKWLVPDNPFSYTWDNEFMYICFNDSCPYYVRGWGFMKKEGNSGSYRLMYNPEKDTCQPVPVLTPMWLREGIVEDVGKT